MENNQRGDPPGPLTSGKTEKKAISADAKNGVLLALALFSQLGLSMCACVLIGVLAGSWLDRWLGTKPWLLLLCSLIGAAAAFKVMYDLAVRGWSKRK